jgi:hypothetical protein
MKRALDLIAALHREVDQQTSELAARHAERLACRKGCSDCCVDGLTCFDVEAENIRRRHADVLDQGVPHPPGRCAFLDGEGACRIYESRPYVCRTQGLPLRWLDEDDEGEPVEYRDICPKNEDGPPLEFLSERDCWTIGPYESGLQKLQNAQDGGVGQRVHLRDLFQKKS